MNTRRLLIAASVLVVLAAPLTAGTRFRGDFSRDGRLDVRDAVSYLLMQSSHPGDELLDFDSNGATDSDDLLGLLRYICAHPPVEYSTPRVRIIFLHHSTGANIWNGGVPSWFDQYNSDNSTEYTISERAFPSGSPYPWNNYPYDYWNIWVEHAGGEPYMEEPTLEILTGQYDVIVFKHCYPVSGIEEDTGSPDITSPAKRIENYKLQYGALKDRLREFPLTRFVVWTGAALVEGATSPGQAERAGEFFDWVRDEWDEAGDNIFLWDFHSLETGGTLYLKPEYAASSSDSHPNGSFSSMAAPLFCQRLIDVIQGLGDHHPITGEHDRH